MLIWIQIRIQGAKSMRIRIQHGRSMWFQIQHFRSMRIWIQEANQYEFISLNADPDPAF
jgi:hypothetical protein